MIERKCLFVWDIVRGEKNFFGFFVICDFVTELRGKIWYNKITKRTKDVLRKRNSEGRQINVKLKDS